MRRPPRADDTLYAACRAHAPGRDGVRPGDRRRRPVRRRAHLHGTWCARSRQDADLGSTTAGEVVGWDSAAASRRRGRAGGRREPLRHRDPRRRGRPCMSAPSARGTCSRRGSWSRCSGRRPRSVDRRSRRGDTMYGGLRGPYLLAGTSALALIRGAMQRAGMEQPPAGDPRPALRARPRDARPAGRLPRRHPDRVRHRSRRRRLLRADLRCRCRSTRTSTPRRWTSSSRSISSGSARSSRTSTRRAGTASSTCSRACCARVECWCSPRSTGPACRTSAR